MILVTRGFELVTRRFELATRGSELLTRGFEFQLVLLSFQLVTRNSQLVFYHITIHILLNISRIKGIYTMKFGQLIEYLKGNIFL